MAQQLDLEEQEQLDQLKHFWRQYGNLISIALIVIFGAVAAWNGWQYWQRIQATQAATMYDEVERAALSGDTAKLDRAFADMKERFARTTFAQQAGLLAAKTYYDAGKIEPSKTALSWVADRSSDAGYQAVARLRLAAVLLDGKDYDGALKQLDATFPADFAALTADRKADILAAQGKKPEAIAQYQAAYKALDERAEYRRLIEVKLNALGVDPVTPAAPAAASAAAPAKP